RRCCSLCCCKEKKRSRQGVSEPVLFEKNIFQAAKQAASSGLAHRSGRAEDVHLVLVQKGIAPAEVRELLVFSEHFYGEGMGKVDHGSPGEWQAVFKRIGLDPHAEAAGDASAREFEDLFYLHSL